SSSSSGSACSVAVVMPQPQRARRGTHVSVRAPSCRIGEVRGAARRSSPRSEWRAGCRHATAQGWLSEPARGEAGSAPRPMSEEAVREVDLGLYPPERNFDVPDRLLQRADRFSAIVSSWSCGPRGGLLARKAADRLDRLPARRETQSLGASGPGATSVAPHTLVAGGGD